jgi:hypothetical protein
MDILHPQRLARFALVICLLVVADQHCDSDKKPPNTNQDTHASLRPVGTPPTNCTKDASQIIYGITIEDTDRLDQVVETIQHVRQETRREVAVRVVIDPQHDLDDEQYKTQLAALKSAGVKVMALLGDSHDLYRFRSDSDFKPSDVSKYKGRIQKALAAFGQSVDIWEIGNEINGEWSGWKEKERKNATQDWEKASPEKRVRSRQWVYNQIRAAYDVLQPADKCMAITFYYNDDHQGHSCWPKPTDLIDGSAYEMINWATEYFTDKEMRDHIKYVFISYYENTECGKLLSGDDEVDAGRFAGVLGMLSKKFTNADLGFGEFGPECDYPEGCPHETEGAKDRWCKRCGDDIKKFIPRYYSSYDKQIKRQMHTPRYIGGYFYWYGLQDMVPKDSPAVNGLIDAIGMP